MGVEFERRTLGARALNRIYLDTARLLVRVAPLVLSDDLFALKGGTAINLFVRSMPRLSVDLDLVFADHRLDRSGALAVITDAIRMATDRLRKRGYRTYAATAPGGAETKLFVRDDSLEVKVEVDIVLRGTVRPPQLRSLDPVARDALQADVTLPVVSVEDLYGSKLVAALDRQHPRDLFDVMQLFLHGGITPGIRRCFVVYLASHNRPIHEVLGGRPHDISGEFERTFAGMTAEPVALSALLDTRERLVSELRAGLDAAERQFLLSIARLEPRWDLLGIGHLEDLPGIRWKLENVGRLKQTNPRKFDEQAAVLERLLTRN